MINETFKTEDNYIQFLKGEETAFKEIAMLADSPEIKQLCERKANNRKLLRERVVSIHSQKTNK